MPINPKHPSAHVLSVLVIVAGAIGGGCEAPTARPERITEADIITPESAARFRGGEIGIRSVPDDAMDAGASAAALVELRTNDLFAAGSAAIVSGARITLAERVAELPVGAAITIEVTPEPALSTSAPRASDLEQARANALRKFLESESGGRWPVRSAVGTASGPERRVVIRSDAPPLPVSAPDTEITSMPSDPASPVPTPEPAAEPLASTAPIAPAPTSPAAEPGIAAMPAPLSTGAAEPARVASTPPNPASAPTAPAPVPVAVTRRPPAPPPPPPPSPAPVRDEGVILASGGVVEFAGAELFEAGTFVLTTEAPVLLKKRLTALSKRRPIIVQAFNDEKSRNTKRSTRATRELSQVRADALADYLRSTEGGGWTVERAVGRAFEVIDDREPDRRVEIIQVR